MITNKIAPICKSLHLSKQTNKENQSTNKKEKKIGNKNIDQIEVVGLLYDCGKDEIVYSLFERVECGRCFTDRQMNLGSFKWTGPNIEKSREPTMEKFDAWVKDS